MANEDDFYSTKGKKMFVIFNNEEFLPRLNLSTRNGSTTDFKGLIRCFTDLKFEVLSYKNCTVMKMKEILFKLSNDDKLSECSLFVCSILSHGDEGIVYGTDDHVSLETLFGYFKGDKCQNLINKPKVFLIQACRGDQFDKGIPHDAILSNNIEKIPIEADVLIGYSTVPGYFSWRNSSAGSWYVQALCDTIQNYAKKEDLLQSLVRVNNLVATKYRSNTGDLNTHGMLQISSFVCMLRKKVFLADMPSTK